MLSDSPNVRTTMINAQGETRKWTSLFHRRRSTGADPLALADANRLRAVLDFFNRDDLAGPLGDGNLSDPFQIRSLVVERVIQMGQSQ